MSVISLVSASFCHGDEIAAACERGGFTAVKFKELIARAAKSSGIGEGKFQNTLAGKTGIFNRFTHERERAIAHLRLALAEVLTQDQLLLTGQAVFLIPERISHILRVCLVAEHRWRQAEAERQGEKNAAAAIQESDRQLTDWLSSLDLVSDPWTPSLYDIVVPMDKTSPEDAAKLILEKAANEAVARTEAALSALADFRIAAKVETRLAQEGHNVSVDAYQGAVTLIINKNVLMLSRLEEELRAIVEPLEGVKSVKTKVGQNFHQADMYRKYDFEMPSKVLLVDDERDFAQTLSERLIMRDMGSAVAYDGESALNMIRDEEPEVMILDLKMPGIDGIEVLRQVKNNNPDIEVIVLTGHGSEKDKDLCMELGAFAFLNKPVDIQLLSQTLMAANQKAQAKKQQ
ncbi:MAG: response regulator [Desulfobulbaceae bacterium]|jgi:CheY-like chemotaxis protein|nr:response regulator [Desulfobulbaceae bacterium]